MDSLGRSLLKMVLIWITRWCRKCVRISKSSITIPRPTGQRWIEPWKQPTRILRKLFKRWQCHTKIGMRCCLLPCMGIELRYELLLGQHHIPWFMEGKRLTAMSHGHLYQQRMKNAFNKKVRLRKFHEGDLVLKKMSHGVKDNQGKWAPN